MVPIRKNIAEMGWPQLPYPLQAYNSTTEDVVNNTIAPQKHNLVDLCFHWLSLHEAQSQFQYYWPREFSTGRTTVPKIICQLIMNEIVRYMPENHISFISPCGYIRISQWTQDLFLRFHKGFIVTPATHK